MELLYVNILNFNQYQNIDLNLGGKFRFGYNSETKQLNIEEDPFYVEDFFVSKIKNGKINQAKVSKINSVIGENGSGKSTFFNFIKQNFPRGVTHLGHPCIIGLIENSVNKIYYFTDNIEISNAEQLPHGFTAYKLKFQVSYLDEKRKKYETKIGPELPKEFKDIDFIYLSNIFDSNNEFEVNGLKNISTNWLIKSDKRKLLENRISGKFTNEVETHKIEDIIRQTNFVFFYENFNKYINFDIPETIYFTPKDGRDFIYDDLARDLINRAQKENPNYWLITELVSRCKEDNQKSDNFIKNTIRTFYANAFINFLDELHSRLSYEHEQSIPASFPKFFRKFKNRKHKELYDFIDEILEKFNIYLNEQKPQNLDIILERINVMLSYYDLLETVINNDRSESILSLTKNGNVFGLNVKNDFALIKQFIDTYSRAFAIVPFLDFKWRSISSGQLALFNIYSRLYSLIDKYTASNQKLKKNIVLMIDEADTFLHPRWSQTMVKSLIDFVSDIYTAHNLKITRKIHIIFTSNSPFIASDIPNNYVIFLKKVVDKDGNYRAVSLNSLEDKKMTFGANIHTLLLDAFFLPNGSIGDFAKQKIDEIIDRLNSPKPFDSELEKSNLFKQINIIGEPIVKRKLLQMFNDRYNIDIDSRVKHLEAELGKLKKIRRND